MMAECICHACGHEFIDCAAHLPCTHCGREHVECGVCRSRSRVEVRTFLLPVGRVPAKDIDAAIAKMDAMRAEARK